MLTHSLIYINIDMIFLETNSGEIIHCSVINDVPNTIPNPESSKMPLIGEYKCIKDGDIYSAYEYDENHQLHKVEMTLKSNPRFFKKKVYYICKVVKDNSNYSFLTSSESIVNLKDTYDNILLSIIANRFKLCNYNSDNTITWFETENGVKEIYDNCINQ